LAVSLVGRVIVGTCGSPGSLRALRYARDLAASSDAVLVPVHAWVPPGGDMADRRAPNPVLRKVWHEAAWQRLWTSVEAAFGGPPDGVEMSPVVVRGIAGEVIVDLARRLDDVIVVGAGRRGPLARLCHGQVARYCVAHAACPVLAVPPSPLAGYARRWTGVLSLRHHALTVGEAFDGADHSEP
jgi:nucleotide-binding universal stress UspA family protein